MNSSYNYADFIGLNLDSNTPLKYTPHDPQGKIADSKTFVKHPRPERPLVNDRPAK